MPIDLTATSDHAAVSIVITNYNYASYLPAAIDSALGQSCRDCEVVVVDDGSTDSSKDVIAAYGDRIRALFKENGGHASAFNAGVLATSGDIVIFLDADDTLEADAAAAALAARDPSTSKVQWYLDVTDESGRATGERIPPITAQSGDLKPLVLDHGPGSYVCPPTTGNAWARSFLERVMPLPEDLRGFGAEPFLMDTAPLYGRVVTVERALGTYRVHRGSMSDEKQLDRPTLEGLLRAYRRRAEFLAASAAKVGQPVHPRTWEEVNWRMLMIRQLLSVTGSPDLRPRARSLISAVGRVQRGALGKAAVGAASFAVRWAPQRIGFGIAERVITPRWM